MSEHGLNRHTRMRRIARIALVYVILVPVALEALLRLVPVSDPSATGATQRVHRFLPGWNVWTGWFAEAPPFSRPFVTGPLSGVSTRQVVVSVNRFGFLYDESEAARTNQDLRIGVIGGSTAECSALEPGKRWPDALERLLAPQIPDRGVTVLNLGLSGQDTRTHLATVAQHAVKLDLDYLVFMLGANDLFRLHSDRDPLDRDDAFATQQCRCVKPFLMRFQLVRRLRLLYHRLKGTEDLITESPDRPYFFAKAQQVMSLPILQSAERELAPQALDDYRTNIVSLAALAVAHGITPVFTTQPMLWKPVMDASEEAVDWLSGVVESDGRRYRLSASAQARALEALNQRLMQTCAERQLKCVDLEKEIPRSMQFFYDSVHLNEAGAESVARHVAQFIARERARSSGRVTAR